MDLSFIIENKHNNGDYVEVIISDFDTVRFMDYYDVCESINDVSACSEELKKAINELGDEYKHIVGILSSLMLKQKMYSLNGNTMYLYEK